MSFITRGRAHAGLAATAAAGASVVLGVMLFALPPLVIVAVGLYFISAAIVAFTALRDGAAAALKVMVGPAAFWLSPFVFAPEINELSPWLFAVPFIGTVFGLLLPALLTAGALRAFNSAGFALTVAGALVAAGIVFAQFTGLSPRAIVLDQLPMLIAQFESQAEFAEIGEKLRQARASAVKPPEFVLAVVGGMQAASVLVSIMIVVFLARWWHAITDNPGGFGREFRGLRLDRRIAAAAGVLAVAAALGLGAVSWLALKLVLVAAAMFLVQGMAVAHGLAAGRAAGRGWLTGLYVLLVFPVVNTFAAAAVTLVGLLDGWMDFRRRFGAAT